MKFKLLHFIIFTMVFGTLIINKVLAHGLEEIVEQSVDKYTIQLKYDAQEASTGEASPISFYLLDAQKTDEVEFKQVWVRIEKDKKLLFSGNINKQELGPTGFTYTFPGAGQYEIYVRFEQDEEASETLAETTLPINIEATEVQEQTEQRLLFYENNPYIPYLVGGVTGLIIGFLGAKVIKKQIGI